MTMKKTTLLLLSLAIFSMSCVLGPLAPVPTHTPEPTQTETASPQPSPTPVLPTLTFTFTPTLIGIKTTTATPRDTPTLLPTDTPIPLTSTETLPPPVMMEGFARVTISLTEIYKAKGCEPSLVRITAQVSNPIGVEHVLLFARFKSKKAARTGKWTSIPMTSFGAGTFIHDLSSNEIKDDAYFESSWIEYQIVSTDKNGREIGRTDIFKERLTMLECAPTPSPTSPNVKP